jgi:anti-sigma B factor antagonist
MFKTLRAETSSLRIGHTVARMAGVTLQEQHSMESALGRQQIVSFDGRITVDNSNEMREKLRAALKVIPKALTVDLSQVTSIDISGLATLVEATRMARRQGTRLVLAGVQGQPASLFEVARLDQLFDIAAEQQST